MRSLSIGTNTSLTTKSRKWTDEHNIKDYRITFADLTDIASAENLMTPDSTTSTSIYFPSHNDVLQYCKNGNDLFIICPPERTMSLQRVIDGDYYGEAKVDLFNWLPFEITFEADFGESINPESVSQNWSWYFKEPFQREYVISGIKQLADENSTIGDIIHDTLIQPLPKKTALAETLSGGMVGVQIDLTPISTAYAKSDGKRPGEWGGLVYILPLEPNRSVENLIQGILQHKYGMQVERDSFRPEWVQHSVLEAESELIDLIQQKQNQLEKISRFKELYWATGDRLEERVFESFELLGLPPKDTEEEGLWDGIIEYDGTMYVLEITGREGKIDVDKARQLQDWVSRVERLSPDCNVSGILVTNSERKSVPNGRGESLTKDAKNHVRQYSNHHLATEVLFGLILALLQGDESAEFILESLFNEII